jgi:thiol-disulfide isomerase/thioredoxin
MGKAERNRRQSAREKIAAQQAAAKRAERRRQLLLTGGSLVVVLAIVVAFIVIKTLGGPASAGSGKSTASAGLVKQVTSVPAATLKSVGKGTANPKAILPISGSAALTESNKPEVLYMGAEYCPFCATERWAMTVALSRFGTFSGLKFIHSSASDNPASIPTLTFYKSTYASKYISFTPDEMQDVNRATLQAPTSAQSAILTKYDAPPQVPSADAGSIPFVDFGNKFMLSGASYSYAVLQGKTWAQVAAALKDPSTPIAKGADGAANMITAAICKLTDNKPATACTPAVQAIEGTF